MDEGSTHVRVAPSGFTAEQWETFMRDGVLVMEDAIDSDEVDEYLEGMERVIATIPAHRPGEHVALHNFVERDPVFAKTIDHPRHVGYAYDIFGEQMKVNITQLFARPPGGGLTKWHFDGPRSLPYSVFSPNLPMEIKVGYWLTDMPEPNMGNFTYVPGSHLQPYFGAYDTLDPVDGEVPLLVRRGAMTLMHGNIWHKVQNNDSDVTRKNFFIAYSPSWVTARDRVVSDPNWLATLTREQRILMRSYELQTHHAKPPLSDYPLFLSRETRSDRDPGRYREDIALNLRKRITGAERMRARSRGQA